MNRVIQKPQTAIRDSITIALAGQPNVGKSTVFNMLTGLSQHVGNWPGKTVEQKTGEFTHNGRRIHLVDLPGTYSLTANSAEERIARDFIIREHPAVVVVLVNAASLERNLYLVAELLALQVPLVIGLNMTDVAERHGIQVEPHVLEAALGAPVVPLVASKNRGLLVLMDTVERLVENPQAFTPNRPLIRPDHQPILEEICAMIAGRIPSPYPEDWVALKLLEGDAEIAAMIQQVAPGVWQPIHTLLMQHEDAYLDIAGGRYEWIVRMVRVAVVQPRAGVITLTDRLDKIATHPLWGLALLLGIFGLVFWLTYTVATPLVDWLDSAILAPLAERAGTALAAAPAWFSNLVVDGLIGGAGTVLTFLPILIVFFAVLGVLEDVGYLARAAYVMDRFMHWMGLHGKSFLPLFLGFGCNVPAVMGARIIEERRARLLTILLAPLVPCTARLAVVAFLAPAFFVGAAALVSWGLVAANMFVLAVTGILVNRLAFRGDHVAFIMEIPLYHLPNLRTIGMFVWNNSLSFARKAGTVIVVVSVLIWALSALPGGYVENSLLAGMGRWLEPLGRLVGLDDWRLIVALLTSFIAKENTIATLGILYGAGEQAGGLAERVAVTVAPAAGLAFLVIQMLFIPCVATMAVIKQETDSWKWTTLSVALLVAISLGAGLAVYQGARLLGWGM
jgi:ferrous iron transport protein B